jgi:hypothetical protein
MTLPFLPLYVSDKTMADAVGRLDHYKNIKKTSRIE